MKQTKNKNRFSASSSYRPQRLKASFVWTGHNWNETNSTVWHFATATIAMCQEGISLSGYFRLFHAITSLNEDRSFLKTKNKNKGNFSQLWCITLKKDHPCTIPKCGCKRFKNSGDVEKKVIFEDLNPTPWPWPWKIATQPFCMTYAPAGSWSCMHHHTKFGCIQF